MNIELSDEQCRRQAEFRSFVSQEVAPHADRYDREQFIPPSLIRELTARRYWGLTLSKEWDGQGLDLITYGLLHEELSRSLSSLAAIINVHDMVAHAIARWGTVSQKRLWLPRLARGEAISAFAISEPNVGSDLKGVETLAKRQGHSFVLTGIKKWITAAQIADIFLMLANFDGKPTAFLVERDQPGLSIKPISGMLGLRAAMLAQIDLEECEVPEDHLIGRSGFGVESIAQTALDLGRYNVACGCVGIAQACLDLCLSYASERNQFGVLIREHELVAQMITEMTCQVAASRLLCWHAGHLRNLNHDQASTHTLMAKYFASRTALVAALNGVQIHGANGCSDHLPLGRYLRDAKVMEIIEGSTQIQQVLIAQITCRESSRKQLLQCPVEAAPVPAVS